jgi:hypothetical protein
MCFMVASMNLRNRVCGLPIVLGFGIPVSVLAFLIKAIDRLPARVNFKVVMGTMAQRRQASSWQMPRTRFGAMPFIVLP